MGLFPLYFLSELAGAESPEQIIATPATSGVFLRLIQMSFSAVYNLLDTDITITRTCNNGSFMV